jgi:hypothetical protein
VYKVLFFNNAVTVSSDEFNDIIERLNAKVETIPKLYATDGLKQHPCTIFMATPTGTYRSGMVMISFLGMQS